MLLNRHAELQLLSGKRAVAVGNSGTAKASSQRFSTYLTPTILVLTRVGGQTKVFGWNYRRRESTQCREQGQATRPTSSEKPSGWSGPPRARALPKSPRSLASLTTP